MRWLSEQEYRLSGAEATGIIFNVAFLLEIKSDFGFRDLLQRVQSQLCPEPDTVLVSPRQAADLLSDLRDELETYFALEEFYGYVRGAEIENPPVSQKAARLKDDHEGLYLELSHVIELAQQLVYRECGPEFTVASLGEEFAQFYENLMRHEEAEMDLVMALYNEDFGVGD